MGHVKGLKTNYTECPLITIVKILDESFLPSFPRRQLSKQPLKRRFLSFPLLKAKTLPTSVIAKMRFPAMKCAGLSIQGCPEGGEHIVTTFFDSVLEPSWTSCKECMMTILFYLHLLKSEKRRLVFQRDRVVLYILEDSTISRNASASTILVVESALLVEGVVKQQRLKDPLCFLTDVQ